MDKSLTKEEQWELIKLDGIKKDDRIEAIKLLKYLDDIQDNNEVLIDCLTVQDSIIKDMINHEHTENSAIGTLQETLVQKSNKQVISLLSVQNQVLEAVIGRLVRGGVYYDNKSFI